jgi:hypothetical protein
LREGEELVIRFFNGQTRCIENSVRYSIDVILLAAPKDFADIYTNGLALCELIEKLAETTGTSLGVDDLLRHHQGDESEHTRHRRELLSDWGVRDPGQ